ncbi:hypothetical protein Tco_0959631 [Tanacetum coccineum]
MEKDVFELKKDDPIKTQVTALVDEHLDARLGATKDEFMNYLSASITTRIIEQVKNQLPQILPKEVSNFAPPVIQHVTASLDMRIARSEEPEFEVADLDMPQDQEENPGNDNEEPKGKTPQQGPTQRWLMTLASSADKPPKTFDELMSTPIDFSSYIMNGLKITNLTQGTLLGPAFKLLKGTRSNYAELEYDFEECYKDLSEKLDWNNLEERMIS